MVCGHPVKQEIRYKHASWFIRFSAAGMVSEELQPAIDHLGILFFWDQIYKYGGSHRFKLSFALYIFQPAKSNIFVPSST